MSKDIGLELNVDLADFFIYALLFRPAKGGIAVGYYDVSGRRQQIYVQEALSKMGIDVQDITKKLQQMGGDYRNCHDMLDLLKHMIESNWSTLVLKPVARSCGHASTAMVAV